jgi:hypothetical protein
MQIDTSRVPGRVRANTSASGPRSTPSNSGPRLSEAGMISVSAVATTDASCRTATEKSASVRTGPPSRVHVTTS